MSADTHTHIHQLMSYELVYTSIHSSIINFMYDGGIAKQPCNLYTRYNYIIILFESFSNGQLSPKFVIRAH